MSVKADAVKQSNYDGAKWFFVVAIVSLGVLGNYYFSDESILYRVIGLIALAVLAALSAFKTTSGKAFWVLLQDARAEIRRVVWPTRQETTQTTMLVVGVVILMGFILWGIDSLLGWLVSTLIG